MSAMPEATSSGPTWRARLGRVPAGLVDALALFLTMRVALGLVAAYAWWKGGLRDPATSSWHATAG
jgi:hypothetical protein